MTNCSVQPDLFPALKSRKVQVDFQGGEITRDVGGLFLRQVDRRLGFTRRLDRLLDEIRRLGSCPSRQRHLGRLRVAGVARG